MGLLKDLDKECVQLCSWKLHSLGLVIGNFIGQMFSSTATAVSQLMWHWLYLFLALTKNKQDEDSSFVLSLIFIYVFLKASEWREAYKEGG